MRNLWGIGAESELVRNWCGIGTELVRHWCGIYAKIIKTIQIMVEFIRNFVWNLYGVSAIQCGLTDFLWNWCGIGVELVWQ